MKNKKIPILGLKTGNSIEKAFDELASRKGIKNICLLYTSDAADE